MADPLPEDSLRVHPGPLREFVTQLFRKADVPPDEAALIARYLVEVDLRGVSSHGTGLLGRYVREFRDGRVNPQPSPRTVQETAVTTVFDGDGGAGYIAATRATQAAIAKAREHGTACASSYYHGHVGSNGIYARLALEHNLISFSVSGTYPWQKPSKPDVNIWHAMNAPPMCFGIPAVEGPPLVLDMSANMFGRQIDEAIEAYPGAVFKSLGLKFVSTLLGAVLPGTILPPDADPAYPRAKSGFLIVAIDPAAMGDGDTFLREITRILDESRSLPPMPGQSTAELPGSLEWQRERDWATEGIPLGERHQDLLKRLADEAGVPVPWE